MVKKIIIFSCFIFLGATQNTFSQEDTPNKDIAGTYQIQVVNSRMQPAIPIEILQEIPQKRKQSEQILIPVSENVRILVYSENEINNPNFVSPKRIVYVVD